MEKQKLVLVNSLSPGDILIMSVAIRSLHKAYPDKFITDVRSPCNEIFVNNPYITPIPAPDQKKEHDIIEELKKDLDHAPIEYNGIKYLISHYPEIHRSGMTGLPFCDGHRMFLAKQLGLDIPRTGMQPDIFLSPFEIDCNGPLQRYYEFKKDEPYWVINAGIKNDYTLKWYNHYQEVVDLLKNKIQFVQVGLLQHNHPALNNVLDLRGKTTLRELFKVSYESEGAICAVSLQMVIMASFKKPCVVVAGAREGVRWQLNPDHQFIYRNGVMRCASYDGCWKSKIEDCINRHPETKQPMCMELIAPEEIVRALELYYLGGRLEKKGLEIGQNMPNLQKMESNMPRIDEKVYEIIDKVAENNKNRITFSLNEQKRIIDSSIFNILRILKTNNPEDKYLESYKWHYEKRGRDFMDTYHFMWWLGANVAPQKILEIGCRTGTSICQLLSAYINPNVIQRIILCDNFSEIGSPDIVLANMKYLNLPIDKVQFLIGSSLDELPKLIQNNETFSYILVDGCHAKEYTKQDLINAAKLIEVNGYIVTDDLTPDGCSLQDVWDEFKYNYKDIFDFIEDHNGKGLGVARRIK